MSTFKVGQRVKRVADPDLILPASSTTMPIGREGTVIVGSVPGHVCVQPDGGANYWHCYPETLAPLTDPSADAFMERLKKLGREPVNSPEKVTV